MKILFSFLSAAFFLIACGSDSSKNDRCPKIDQIDIIREEYIPDDAVKVTEADDASPPVLHLTSEYEEPVPLSGIINTAGAEDSAYYAADGGVLYFWFTPDVDVPVEKQVSDPSTGIYRTTRLGAGWSDSDWSCPERVWLFDVESLEGCACVQGNTLWFCAAKCGVDGLKHYYSEYINGDWTNGKQDDVLNDPEYRIGEFHITADGNTVYFHSDRTGGIGGRDLWKIEKSDGGWGSPVNLAGLNTGGDENFPFLTLDGSELWFCGDSRIDNNSDGTPDYFGAVFRSEKSGDSWAAPVEVVSQLAGEPTVDGEGNVYFTHHFYKNDEMIEADIYVLRKK